MRSAVGIAANLDGCGTMLRLDDGSTLEPVRCDFQIYPNVQYQLGYSIEEEFMSICMMADSMVSIECLKWKPSTQDCYREDTVLADSWLHTIIEENQIQSIDKFHVGEASVFSFSNGTNSWLYSCTGELLCSGEAEKKCLIEIKETTPFWRSQR